MKAEYFCTYYLSLNIAVVYTRSWYIKTAKLLYLAGVCRYVWPLSAVIFCKWLHIFAKISPRRRTPSRGAGRPKFNQLKMVITFTYKPSLVRIDARNFELSW